MGFREFIKPDAKKIILAILIYLIIPIVAYKPIIMCQPNQACIANTFYFSLIAMFLTQSDTQTSITPNYVLFLGLIIAYLLSASIIYSFSKISDSTKMAFWNGLKISKAKLVITILGWLTLITIYAHAVQLTNNYDIEQPVGGPITIGLLYTVGEFISVILMPFAFITNALFVIIVFKFQLLSGILQYPGLFLTYSGYIPEYLKPNAIWIVLPFLAIYWYFISCFIFEIFNY